MFFAVCDEDFTDHNSLKTDEPPRVELKSNLQVADISVLAAHLYVAGTKIARSHSSKTTRLKRILWWSFAPERC